MTRQFKQQLTGCAIGACSALALFPASAEAQSPLPPGTLSTELATSYTQAREVANGPDVIVESASLVQASAQFDARYTMSPSLEALLSVPLLSYTRFDGEDEARLSHIDLGGRLYLAHAETDGFTMTLHSALALSLPTTGSRNVGETYVNDLGERTEALTADGFLGAQPSVGLTMLIENVWVEVGAGLLVRTRAVNRINSRANIHMMVTPRIRLDGTVTSSLAQDPRPDPTDGQPPLLSVTGIGEYNERVAFTLRADYQVGSAYQIGLGVLAPIQQVEHATSPTALLYFSYQGFHPSELSKMIDR